MNEWDKLHRQAERYKAEYPPGTRIMLKVKRSLTFEHLGEDIHRVKDNTRGNQAGRSVLFRDSSGRCSHR